MKLFWVRALCPRRVLFAEHIKHRDTGLPQAHALASITVAIFVGNLLIRVIDMTGIIEPDLLHLFGWHPGFSSWLQDKTMPLNLRHVRDVGHRWRRVPEAGNAGIHPSEGMHAHLLTRRSHQLLQITIPPFYRLVHRLAILLTHLLNLQVCGIHQRT